MYVHVRGSRFEFGFGFGFQLQLQLTAGADGWQGGRDRRLALEMIISGFSSDGWTGVGAERARGSNRGATVDSRSWGIGIPGGQASASCHCRRLADGRGRGGGVDGDSEEAVASRRLHGGREAWIVLKAVKGW